MNVIRVMRTLGLALLAAGLAVAGVVTGAGGERATASPGASAALEIILALDNANVGTGIVGTWLPVYLTNPLQPVGGFQFSLLLDRPDLFKFRSDSIVETTIVCIDTTDCDPADTTIDTVAAANVDTAGTAASGWEYLQGRAQSAINLVCVGIADQPGGGTKAPIPTGGPRLLVRVFLERIASKEMLDTLQDRTARVFIDGPATYFSTPGGQVIGRLDSARCLNPPTCTQWDTVYYNDPTAVILVGGSRTFLPPCLKGDVNKNGVINSADIIYLVNYVFKGGPPPLCSPTVGDVNCSGTTNSADIIYLVNYVFKGGPPPLAC